MTEVSWLFELFLNYFKSPHSKIQKFRLVRLLQYIYDIWIYFSSFPNVLIMKIPGKNRQHAKPHVEKMGEFGVEKLEQFSWEDDFFLENKWECSFVFIHRLRFYFLVVRDYLWICPLFLYCVLKKTLRRYIDLHALIWKMLVLPEGNLPSRGTLPSK